MAWNRPFLSRTASEGWRRPPPEDSGTLGFGWVSILVPLGLGFVMALALAYQAWDAGREHRVSARSSAREQAEFAAYLLATSVHRLMQEELLYTFYPVELARARAGGALPDPDVLRVDPERSRCEPESAGASRRYFRFQPASGALLVTGPASPEFEGWIRSLLARPEDESPAGSSELDDRTVRHRSGLVGDRRTLITYRAWGDGAERVVYGFESCWRTRQGNVFERALATTQALPPRLVGSTPSDSLFRLSVRGADSVLVFGESWARPPAELYDGTAFYGTVRVQPARVYPGLELRVSLLPRVAERLIRGGLPRSRLPLALGLLLLTAALLWIALRQLRRGHELISMRARFVQSASHELRTPLQQILLFSDLLRTGRLQGDAQTRQALDIVHSETQRLIALTENLLQFSSRQPPPAPAGDLDVTALTQETVEAFRPLAAGRQDEIRVSSDGPVYARVHADGLKRVLINLLDNALKYGPEGQTIAVEVRDVDGWAEVAVSDGGPGIPEAQRSRIWDPFVRLEREGTSGTAGSGIGLSIVRQIVGGMGGRVEVGRGAQGGARFSVRVPRAQHPPQRAG